MERATCSRAVSAARRRIVAAVVMLAAMAYGSSANYLAAAEPAAIPPTAPTDVPKLEHVYTAVVGIAPIQNVGETLDGIQRIIPITGGTFEGTKIRGTVSAGGADWNRALKDGSTIAEAYYFMRTDDGVIIKILNRGVLAPRPAVKPGESSAKNPPLFTTPVFEAPRGKYEWLNSGVYVGTITPGEGGKSVTIRVFKVT